MQRVQLDLLAALDTSADRQAAIRAASSALVERLQFMRQLGVTFDGKRKTYEIFGYKENLTPLDYRLRYLRGGLAGTAVDALPDAAWRGDMWLQDDDDVEKTSPFEAAWYALEQRLHIRATLRRVTVLSRLSAYAVLLIGDGTPLAEPLRRASGPDALLFLKPYAGSGGPNMQAGARQIMSGNLIGSEVLASATIDTLVEDPRDARYGEPKTYRLTTTSTSAADNPITDWSRLLHVAENCLDNNVYGLPALERVWNLFDDLEKVTGGGAEAFFLRANQGLQLDVDKDLELSTEAKQELKDQADEFANNIRRIFRTRGVTANALGSDVANFNSPADAIITQIAGALRMPKRIFTGSEMGELASSQDRDNWKDHVDGYQTSHLTPFVVRPFIDRLIAYGFLPTPANGTYEVKWPHIQTLTEQERADGAAKWASVNSAAGVTVFTANEIRDKWYGFAPAEESDQEGYKAALAFKMALTNKTQGVTVFTSAEIRKTCYGWDALTPEQEVPIGAPERISVDTPPPVDGAPIVVPQPLAAAHAELASVLAQAIESGNHVVVDRILGLSR